MIVVLLHCVATYPLAATEADSFSISDLAKEFGVTPRALRFYEEEGLISPRRDGPTRVYSRRDRARVAWILRGKSLGFSLDEIGELLDLYDLGDGRQKQRVETVRLCRERAENLRVTMQELEAMIEQLDLFAGTLEEKAVHCGTVLHVVRG